MSETKLLTCPFCGEEADIAYDTRGCFNVFCCNNDCFMNAIQMNYKTEEEAIAAWNTRKPVEGILERLEELKMAEYDDSDEEPEYTDVEDWFDEGESSGRFEAYGKAIEIVKEGVNNG